MEASKTLTKKTTVFQRLKRALLGKKKPDFLTRMSVIVGFIVWLYLFSWHLLTLLSLILLANLHNAPNIRSHYVSVS